MIFIIIILIIIVCFIPANNNSEIQNNEIEQVNIVQEQIQYDDNTEYTYVPVTNGKTVQMIRIPKVEK